MIGQWVPSRITCYFPLIPALKINYCNISAQCITKNQKLKQPQHCLRILTPKSTMTQKSRIVAFTVVSVGGKAKGSAFLFVFAVLIYSGSHMVACYCMLWVPDLILSAADSPKIVSFILLSRGWTLGYHSAHFWCSQASSLSVFGGGQDWLRLVVLLFRGARTD